MSKIYYNPAIRADLPCKQISNPVKIDKTNLFYELKAKRAFADKKEALTQDFEGYVKYYEDGELYEGYLTQEWSYKAVTDVIVDGGINWDTYYAVSPELLPPNDCNPQMNEYGLYSIQVHYSGRTR